VVDDAVTFVTLLLFVKPEAHPQPHILHSLREVHGTERFISARVRELAHAEDITRSSHTDALRDGAAAGLDGDVNFEAQVARGDSGHR